MASKKTHRFGELKPRYRFAINPFPGVRWSRCPRCDKLTHARKFPLLIGLEPLTLITLGKTCRYCTPCEFIVVDQEELETELVIACEQRGNPEMIGNPYHVLGTVELKHWKEAMRNGMRMEDLRAHTADIKSFYTLNDPRPRWVAAEPAAPDPQKPTSRE